jgi:hypothetical protein
MVVGRAAVYRRVCVRCCLEHTPIRVRETKCLGETEHGREIGVRAGASFEIGDATGAEPRALSERLLSQGRRDTIMA